jgi:hypothetical protein
MIFSVTFIITIVVTVIVIQGCLCCHNVSIFQLKQLELFSITLVGLKKISI